MIVPFSIFHKVSGEVIRSGMTQPTEILNQLTSMIDTGQITNVSDYDVIADDANRIEDKVIYENGKPKKVKRDLSDIAARKEARELKQQPVPHGQQRASLTNDQLSELLARIEALENKE